jgi:probable rRNA maturation factor
LAPTAKRPTIHVAVDGLAAPVSRARARQVVESVLRAEKVRRALVSVAFVSARDIARLNRKHLGHTGATDVISFGFSRLAPRDSLLIGDIYVAPAVASGNARAARRPVREEVVRLLVHGTLHVLGYDHPDDERRERSPMWRRQERLVNRIIRNGSR